MMVMAIMLMVPATADGQTGNHRTKSSKRRATTTARRNLPKRPDAPSALSQSGRTIKDMLFYPFACLPEDYSSKEEVQQQLSDLFGQCENINGCPGLHFSEAYDFTYRGAPIGTAFYDWMDHRQWYHFYFETKTEADRFYNILASDIKAAGIPLARDKIYGGLSNRLHPVSIFKWVFLTPSKRVKEADGSNINGPDVVGMYEVEFGVYKR